jgi:hypothetical protein
MKGDLEEARKRARASIEFKHFVPVTRKEIFGAMLGTAIVCSMIGFGIGAAICRRGARVLEVINR